jgi:hypothetical protein
MDADLAGGAKERDQEVSDMACRKIERLLNPGRSRQGKTPEVAEFIFAGSTRILYLLYQYP